MHGNLVHYAWYQVRYCPVEPFKTTVLRLHACLIHTSGFLFDNATHTHWFSLNNSGQFNLQQ